MKIFTTCVMWIYPLLHPNATRMSLKYHTSPVSASALFLDQSDLSIPLNSQSQVVRTRVAAVCSTLVADVSYIHYVTD